MHPDLHEFACRMPGNASTSVRPAAKATDRLEDHREYTIAWE
jgi:hypothetical protein